MDCGLQTISVIKQTILYKKDVYSEDLPVNHKFLLNICFLKYKIFLNFEYFTLVDASVLPYLATSSV